jgi:hypothetical protein
MSGSSGKSKKKDKSSDVSRHNSQVEKLKTLTKDPSSRKVTITSTATKASRVSTHSESEGERDMNIHIYKEDVTHWPWLYKRPDGDDNTSARESRGLLGQHNMGLEYEDLDRLHRMLCESYGYKGRHYLGDRAFPMSEILLDRLYLADPRPEGRCEMPVRYNVDDELEGADIG